MARKRIGEYLIDKGVLTLEQVDQILEHSRRTGLRFGESTIKLKYLSREKLFQAFGSNLNADFFHLDARFFPKATLNAFTSDQIIRWGALGLGFKDKRSLFRRKKILNIGLLERPSETVLVDIQAEALKHLGEGSFDSIKVFLVFADQLLDVLRVAYGVEEAKIRSMPESSVNRILRMFIAEDFAEN